MSLLSAKTPVEGRAEADLTPGLVQMVTVLQLNRLELKEMINQEIVNNPVLKKPPKMALTKLPPRKCWPSSRRIGWMSRPTSRFWTVPMA